MFPSFNRKQKQIVHASFYQSNIERLLHLSPDDCKNELKQLKYPSKKGTTRKLVNFQVFPDSAHQAELERYQGHTKLDDKFLFRGAQGILS